jgi:hypothetical protein
MGSFKIYVDSSIIQADTSKNLLPKENNQKPQFNEKNGQNSTKRVHLIQNYS